jgi:hydrogenase expression/formation protein HypD
VKFIDEYRNADVARQYARAIADVTTGRWRIMEVCGGQTHSIVRFGLDELLPDGITLVHGPGCPVCVTPAAAIDKAVAIASQRDVILCSFGDMLRVPGSRDHLLAVRSRGGVVRVVYSPLDALRMAESNPGREIVFFAVGFETTAPANAMAVYQARQRNIENFSLLVSHVLVPPAVEAILSSPTNLVQGFLAAGHVCAVMGYHEYEPIAKRYGVPIVVTGFEPLDILQGILMCTRQLEAGRSEVENQYTRSVSRPGNRAAQELIKEVFRVIPREWRGIGLIERSGLGLSDRYADFDAERRFAVSAPAPKTDGRCISGQILLGVKKPYECSAFGAPCTPESPLGATMVSSEGACAAYYRYRPIARKEV